MNFSDNGLIVQLTTEDQHRVQEICQPVMLAAGETLCPFSLNADPAVYFLTGACVAMVAEGPEPASLALGLVGSEGAIGLFAALQNTPDHLRFVVQTPGAAWRADSSALTRLLQQQPAILWSLARYLGQLADDVAGMAASIQRDDILTRLASWLVLSAQRAGTQRLQLTHEHLARMLGVRRVSITLAAGELKSLGLITYQRGSLSIHDVQQLAMVGRTVNSTLL